MVRALSSGQRSTLTWSRKPPAIPPLSSVPRPAISPFFLPDFRSKTDGFQRVGRPRVNLVRLSLSMLKRDHQLVLPTQARAPGFRVELSGTTFRLIATGAWTVHEAAQLDAALKRLRVPIPPTPDFTGEMDIAGIAEIDTAGAWLLQRTAASWQAGGLRTH